MGSPPVGLPARSQAHRDRARAPDRARAARRFQFFISCSNREIIDLSGVGGHNNYTPPGLEIQGSLSARDLTKNGAEATMTAERVLLHKRRLATSLRRGVMLMGDGRGANTLRLVICFIIALALMILIAPKAY